VSVKKNWKRVQKDLGSVKRDWRGKLEDSRILKGSRKEIRWRQVNHVLTSWRKSRLVERKITESGIRSDTRAAKRNRQVLQRNKTESSTREWEARDPAVASAKTFFWRFAITRALFLSGSLYSLLLARGYLILFYFAVATTPNFLFLATVWLVVPSSPIILRKHERRILFSFNVSTS
jgi:hypothetical protein